MKPTEKLLKGDTLRFRNINYSILDVMRYSILAMDELRINIKRFPRLKVLKGGKFDERKRCN